MPATKIFAGMARSYTMGIIGVFSKNWNYTPTSTKYYFPR